MADSRPSSGSSGGRSRGSDDDTRVGWRMAGIGFEVAAQVGAGALLGWLFDRWQGTAPKGVLIGGVLGIAVAMWTLIKGTLKLNRQLDEASAKRKKASPSSSSRTNPPVARRQSTDDHDDDDDDSQQDR